MTDFSRHEVWRHNPQPAGDSIPARLSRGRVILPDGVSDRARELAARIAGGDAEVYTASEWIAAGGELSAGDARQLNYQEPSISDGGPGGSWSDFLARLDAAIGDEP